MTGTMNWLQRAEAFLDGYGRPAWLGAMVLGFVAFWPIGLTVLGYMIWSERMGCWRKHRNHSESRWSRGRSSGNRAFDAYRDETLRRLEDEQEAFTSFLERLRLAKDKAEFDHFLRDRQNAGPSTPDASGSSFQPAG